MFKSSQIFLRCSKCALNILRAPLPPPPNRLFTIVGTRLNTRRIRWFSSAYPSHVEKRNVFPEIKFEEHLTLEECHRRLESSQLVSGTLKIRGFQKDILSLKAYIQLADGRNEISIFGMANINRGLHGDKVAVEILHNKKDQHGDQTGKIVCIMQEKHSRITAGYLNSYKNNQFGFALLSPNDTRVPRIMIPLDECPPKFKSQPGDYDKILFVAKIISWGLDRPFALGKLVQNLGEAGHIEPETQAILIKNGIDSSEFEEEIVNSLPNEESWSVTAEDLSQRKDLRNECILSIDPATARDLDDALSCKRIGKDLFEVGVHIADVSAFVMDNSLLDKVAQDRATSVYLVQKVIPMLPRVLCEQLCSLNPNVERFAYSVIWQMKSDGSILKEWFGRSVIKSCVKLSYEEAQKMIDSKNNELSPEGFPPICGNFTLGGIAKIVKDLYKISKYLREKRFQSGALSIEQKKLGFTLDHESKTPNGFKSYEYKDSNKLIEEFMLLANMAVGTKILQNHPNISILKRHEQPGQQGLENLKILCENYGIPFDISNRDSLNNSFKMISELDPEIRDQVKPAVTLFLLKCSQPAKYFCTGSLSIEEYQHYALNVPIYTHFTSPIRRYPDIMVHRLLTTSLDSAFSVNEDIDGLQKIADHCNDKKWAAKDASQQSDQLFFAAYVRECGPIKDEAVVMTMSNKEIEVLSTKLGTTYMIDIAELPHLQKHVFKTDGAKQYMTFYWNDPALIEKRSPRERLESITKKLKRIKEINDGFKDEDEDEGEEPLTSCKVEELTIFSPVDVILRVESNKPTKVITSLVNPFDERDLPGHGL